MGRRARWALTGAAAMGLVLLMPATASATPIRQQQWWVDALQVPKAQSITRGAGVVVAVIDGKIDSSNPDLSGQLVSGTAINGGTSDATHGTEVAGVIAAKGGGQHDVVGVAPGAKIMPIELPTKFSNADIANGIRYATDHGAGVINISSGAVAATPPSEEVAAVNYALSKNVVVVAAAGNTADGMSAVASPAAIPGVVAVSGADKQSNAWSGSVTGTQVVIAAPSVDVVTTGPMAESQFQSADGTSMAAPIVAGTVALIRAKYPKLDAANVINRLVKTAKDQGDPGRDKYFGYGTVRPVDALTENVPAVSRNPLGGGGGGASAGSTATHSARAVGPVQTHISTRGWITFAVIGLLVIVGIIVLIVVLTGRRRRRGPGTGPPGGAAYPGAPAPYGAAGQYQQPNAPAGPPSGYGPPAQSGPPSGYGPPSGAQPPGAQQLGAQQLGAQPPGAQPPGAQPPGAQQLGAQPPGAQPPAAPAPGPPAPGPPASGTQAPGGSGPGLQPLWPQRPGTQGGGPQPPPGR